MKIRWAFGGASELSWLYYVDVYAFGKIGQRSHKIVITTIKIKVVVVLFGIKYLAPLFNKNGMKVNFSGNVQIKNAV